MATPSPEPIITKASSSKQLLEHRPSTVINVPVINVPNASRLLDTWKLQRQKKFQTLVRRYMSQIRDGCKNELCTTPSCWSAKKRISSGPARQPKALAVCILAHHLASQDAPEKGLCPHELQTDPSVLGLEPQSEYDVKALGQNAFNITMALGTITRNIPDPQTVFESLNTAAGNYLPLPVTSRLDCETMEQLKTAYREELNGRAILGHSVSPFLDRSLFFVLSDPDALLQSFRDRSGKDEPTSSLSYLDNPSLMKAFHGWHDFTGSLIFDSLWITAGALFTRPQEPPQPNPELLSGNGPTVGTAMNRCLSNEEAAHIAMVCIHALTSFLSPTLEHLKYELEYEPAFRLADRLVRGIRARMCFDDILQTSTLASFAAILFKHLEQVSFEQLALLLEWLRTIVIKKWNGEGLIDKCTSVGASILVLGEMHRLRRQLNLPKILFIPYLNLNFDRSNECSAYLERINPNVFHLFEHPWLFDIISLTRCFRTMNFKSLSHQYQQTQRMKWLQNHLGYLQFDRSSIAFSDHLLLEVPRAYALGETITQLSGLERRMLLKPLRVRLGEDEGEVGQDQGGVQYEFFHLVLGEALNPCTGLFTFNTGTHMSWFRLDPPQPPQQIEKKSASTFRAIITEQILDRIGGSSLSGTQLGSHFLQAKFDAMDLGIVMRRKYEVVGLIFSLAVYQGITLPVSFPLALYRVLLMNSPFAKDWYGDDIDLIRDGWPADAKSLGDLASRDIESLALSYFFEYDTADGWRKAVNMQHFETNTGRHFSKTKRWPEDAEWEGLALKDIVPQEFGEDPDASVDVTRDNVHDFIKDKVKWLTFYSVAPQILAFRKGFFTCLEEKAVHLFDPRQLKMLVEGENVEINVAALKAATRYKNTYNPSHHTIVRFWNVVEGYNQKALRKLLKFVTASDRVPITGYESLNFKITPAGPDRGQLPHSSTCFHELFLPRYMDEEVLRRKLGQAIENCEGFGLA